MGDSKSVLIVDDSRLTRMMITKIVITYHPEWKITEAVSADLALQICDEHSFDFITLDNNMPGISGLDAYPLLREKQPAAKIGLFTANIQKSIQERCKNEGVILVEKPITEERVAQFFS